MQLRTESMEGKCVCVLGGMVYSVHHGMSHRVKNPNSEREDEYRAHTKHFAAFNAKW